MVFAVTIAAPGDGDYTSIRDSVRVLPATSTTVPLATRDGWTPAWGAAPGVAQSFRRRLEAAGLRVRTKTAERSARFASADYASLPQGSLLGVTPSPGSVVDARGTVTLTVSGRSLDPARSVAP